jgi:hypothetical protein
MTAPPRSSRRVLTGAFGSLLVVAGASPAQLVIDGAEPGSALGGALAMAGDVNGDGVADLVLGAPDSAAGGPDSGEVRIVSGSDGALLFAVPGSGARDDLGFAVAGVGDADGDGRADVLAGAPQARDPGEEFVSNRLGYARLLSGAGGAELQFHQGEQVLQVWGGGFGSAVAGPGDLDLDGAVDLVVGEYGADLEGNISTAPGRVHVLSGADGSGIRELVGTVDLSAKELGRSVAAAGDRDGDGVGDLFLGAPYPDYQGPALQEGISLVSGATGAVLWTTPQATLVEWVGLRVVACGDVDGDGTADVLGSQRAAVVVYSGVNGAVIRSFPTSELLTLWGPSAASVGDVNGDGCDDVAVGDPLTSTALTAGSGSVRIYSGKDGYLLGEIAGTQTDERFGAALASGPGIFGEPGVSLVIGAPGHDGPHGVDSGRVQVVSPASALGIPLLLTLPDPPPDTAFATALAMPGDVDNDGWDDVVVGDMFDSTAGYLAGAVHVFSGRDGSLLHLFHGSKALERLGWAVARPGDLDLDGHADILASAPFAVNPFGPGVVRAWSGRDGALLLTLSGSSNNDYFGDAIGSAGDVDQDGVPDLIVGAPYDDLAGANRGTVRVYSGASGALLLQVTGDELDAEFGGAVAGAGDVDGDGVPDVAIGARLDNGAAGLDSGRVLLVSGTTGAVLFAREGSSAFANLGAALAAPGDVSGDGVPDLLAGMPGDDAGGEGAGSAMVLSGVDGGTLSALPGAAPGFAAGSSLATLGDLDGDGVGELVIGAPAGPGRADVVDGTATVLLFSVSGMGADDQFGRALAGGGDVDNDGRPDLAVGAAHADYFGASDGVAIVFSLSPAFTPWESAGHVLPGGQGAPKLTGDGPLLPATVATLALAHGTPGAPSTLVIGFAALETPFKGGVLVPDPAVLVAGLPIGPAGDLVLGAAWPAGVPAGTELWFQHWFPDSAALQGYAASNAVKAVVP